MMKTKRSAAYLAVLLLLGLSVAAGAVTTAASGKGHAQTAAAAGTKTIGVLSLCEACEGVHRMTVGMKQAAAAVGWKIQLVDGQGAPDKLLAGMNALVQAKVSAIVIEAVEPALVLQAFKTAVAAHIPMVTEDVGHTNAGALSDVSPNERGNVALLDKAMFGFMGNKPGKIAAIRYMSLKTTADRYRQLVSDATKYGLDLVASHDSVAPNFGDDAATFTSQMLTANPDLAAVWAASTGDPAAIGAAQAVDRMGAKTIVVGYNGDKQALTAIRANGSFKATIAFPVEEGSWVAVDLLLRHFASKTVKNKEINLPGAVVTAANVPAAGAGYFNKWGNYGQKYTALWKATYGIK